MSINATAPLSFVAATALEAYRLVYINSSGQAAYATANIKPFGVTQLAVASGAYVPVVPLNGAATLRISMSGAAAVGSDVFATASGQGSTTGSGISVGKVVDASLAADDYAGVAIGGGPGTVNTYNVTQAAALTLTTADSGAFISNLGASGAATVNLPSAPPAGCVFNFIVSAAQELRVNPGDNDKLYINGAAQADGKYAGADDEGESLTCVSNSAGDWYCRVTGTWTVET